MSRKKIDVMITAFRDGFQSAYGARVLTPDFLPAVAAAREAGVRHFEAGGGARFQSLYFYCNEDAFAMMDAFRATAGPDANLQTLARGINVVALDSQPREIIDLHAKLFKRHGITTIRNFDALNDVNNLIDSAHSITRHGLKHEVCITLMSLPPGCTGAHDAAFYGRVLEDLLAADIPFDSLCYKDASGTATPAVIHETIRHARKRLPAGARIAFHTHDTAGTGVICNQAAIEAGADQVDLSFAPCSGGTCQPDAASMWHALRGTGYELDLDIEKVMRAEEVFKDCMASYFMPPEAKAVEPLIPWCPLPGGALTANTQMLRDNGIMHRYHEVIAAMGEVVRVGGFGTSVTPVSQFYFQQAFNNVLFGKWEKFAEGYGKMVLGYFGKTPVPPDPEIVKLASERMGLPVATKSPLEMDEANPAKGVAPAQAKLAAAGLPETEENIFIVAACGEKGIGFLKGEAKVGIRKVDTGAGAASGSATGAVASAVTGAATGAAAGMAAKGAGDVFTVSIDGRDYTVRFDGDRATLDGRSYQATVKPGESAAKTSAAKSASAAGDGGGGGGTAFNAPMPGVVVRVQCVNGDPVTAGATLLVIEAMKMEMALTSPVAGVVQGLVVKAGDQVAGGQLLARIEA